MSQIAFVWSYVGGGKSRIATEWICEELRKSDRMIVTNVRMWIGDEAVIPEGKLSLAEWCHMYVEKPVDIGKRVRLLKHEEVAQFYRFYAGYTMSMLSDGKSPNLDERQELQKSGLLPFGTLFVIDEVHSYFPARAWQSTGKGVEDYMSQLRKFNDDLILITQDPGKVDKNFKRNATDWYVCQNKGKQRMAMGVNFPGHFRVHHFALEPYRNDKPDRTYKYELHNMRYCDVYDTMAGAGLTGGLLPEEKEPHKHWWRWVVVGLVALVAIVVVPRMLMHALGKATSSALAAFHGGVGASMPRHVAAGSGAAAEPIVSVSRDESGVPVRAVLVAPRDLPGVGGGGLFGGSTVKASEDVVWLGYELRGSNEWHIFLSDGSDWRSGDGHLTMITKSFVVVDRVMYKKETPAALRAREYEANRVAAEDRLKHGGRFSDK